MRPFLASLALLLTNIAAAQTTATATLPKTITAAAATDNSSSASVYTRQPWGELGILKLKAAPYPDDTRTTGFQSRNGTFPYEGHYDDPTVVFGVPSGYKRGSTADLIVHFHGWSNEAPRAFTRYKLGEQLAASGRNAIVVLPQGPKNAKDSSIGKLLKPGGFARLIDESLARLIADGKLDAGTTVGNIILSGHSGGYTPVGRCLEVGGMNAWVKEIWLFDATYGELNSFARFALSAAQKPRVRSLFTDHLTHENIQLMSQLNLGGAMAGLYDEEQITTAGTSATRFNSQPVHSKGATPGTEELEGILQNQPLFFMHTHLAHDAVIDERSYFENFARASPWLQPR